MGSYTEQEIFALMYNGEKNRDASSKILGFIYQDLIAIEKLLNDEIEYVATEFLEDVTYIKNKELHIIQVKHYQNSNPNWNEIIPDLYCQYLKYTLLDGNKTVRPGLIIYHKSQIAQRTKNEILKHLQITEDRLNEDKKTSEETAKVIERFNGFKDKEKNKYTKEEKRDGFIKECAYRSSISEFYDKFYITTGVSINDKIKAIKDDIIKKYTEDQCELVFGVALQYVQEQYCRSERSIDSIRLTKRGLDLKLEEIRGSYINKLKTYLHSIVYEYYSEIIDNINRVDGVDEKETCKIKDILRICCNNTIEWLKDLVSNEDGCYKLINTVTNKSNRYLLNFKKLSDDEKFTKVKECRNGIENFLGVIWKLLLNICLDKKDLNVEDMEMMNIRNYIDNEQSKFISIKFEKYRIKDIILLPSFSHNDDIIDDIVNIFTRIREFKPKTWFIKGPLKANKTYTYNFEVSRLDEEGPVAEKSHDITDIDDDSFSIECMHCLKTGKKSIGWSKQDESWKCIFERGCTNNE